MDDLHFLADKNKAQFKIKAWVGPFVCNSRTFGKEEDFLLKKMNFNFIFTWYYDSFGMISKLRVEQKTTPYTHTPQPKIEKYMNRDQWEENILHEAEE